MEVKIQKSNLPSSVSIIQGRANIYSTIGNMIQGSTSVIYIVGTIYDMMKMYHVEIPEKIKACVRNGGEVRILTEICGEHTRSLINRMNASETRVTQLPYKGKIVVEKGRQVITSGTMRGTNSISSINDSVVYITSSEIVNNMFDLCEHLWKTAKNPIIVTNTCPIEEVSKFSY